MMKTFKNLYPQIHTFENLYYAFRKARRGKRGQAAVAQFENNLEENLLTLQEVLQSESYQPGAYTHFTLYEKKPRYISAAPFKDRVVHHALCQMIEPIWEARFIPDSYACRVGKGTHAALNRCQQFARSYPYVLQTDITQFFPSVDHQILRRALAHHIACPATLRLCDKIIASGEGIHRHTYTMQWFPGDDLWAANRPRGLPIGNQTSQFWANVYLHQLDQFIKQQLRCKAYLRYVDDVLLFAPNKATLHGWQREISQFLQTLRLIIHPRKSRVYPIHCGIPFLGFTTFPTHRKLQRQNGVNFMRRFKRQIAAYAGGRISRQQLDAAIQGWIAHAQQGNTYRLRGSIFWQMIIPPAPEASV
ncbi:MAG: RNA-dependent DNA polymerase [Chloroflexi bacterium]|nr:RNA-dependent DNA polymerase [Chloroflexota bacterium]